jgi:hypothetical protein
VRRRRAVAVPGRRVMSALVPGDARHVVPACRGARSCATCRVRDPVPLGAPRATRCLHDPSQLPLPPPMPLITPRASDETPLRRRPPAAVRCWAHGDRRRTAREHRTAPTTAARRSRPAAARPRCPRPGRLGCAISTRHVTSGRPRQSETAEPSCATERARGASGRCRTESGARSAGRRGAGPARATGRARRRAADNRRRVTPGAPRNGTVTATRPSETARRIDAAAAVVDRPGGPRRGRAGRRAARGDP